MVNATKDTLKLFEYKTPVNVFLYITNINIPSENAMTIAMAASIKEKLPTFSKKLDLKISLIIFSPLSSY